MESPLFIATQRFDLSDGEAWVRYAHWAKIPKLIEVVTLDMSLCPRIVQEMLDEDWNHIVCEDFRLNYFRDWDYLKLRIKNVLRKNILGLYRNPKTHIAEFPSSEKFTFVGYDLIEEATQISALTNCGGFPDVFQNDELNCFGLIGNFERASEVRQLLAKNHPEEPHAQCEMYAIWRLDETESGSESGEKPDRKSALGILRTMGALELPPRK